MEGVQRSDPKTVAEAGGHVRKIDHWVECLHTRGTAEKRSEH